MAEEFELDTRNEADATPDKTRRRWLLEIKLAQKREKEWRTLAKQTLEVYRGTKRKKNSFNILWANTEVLRPALYNSAPKPDVRRRFRQNDALGKAVSEVMERSVTYCVDAYDLDNCLQNDTLDALLPGRGVSRVRYVPSFKTVPKSGEEKNEGADEAPEADREEVDYEQALCEHVQWDDFLHGPGKTWEEVEWSGFRHRMTRDDLVEKFGEKIGGKITLNDVDDDDVNSGNQGDDVKEVFKRAEVWEIWDKTGKKVFFVSDSYKASVIFPKDTPDGAPPLALKNFFPVPRPLQLFEDSGTLVPVPLYELYREQAEEVDRLSTRINKIVNACRVRFIHDSTLSELKALMDAGDNEGIPVEQARAWMTNGGIEKAIWWMPIDKVVAVLRELYVARDAAKQVIYEITGISDILRGATDPNETLGAQKMKANSSSLRLQRMVTEVQRYTRDLIRLLAEVIGENFDAQTLAQMTGLQFPTAQQKQVVQVQMQAAQKAMAQPGAQPPPEVQQKMQEAQQVMAMPSWEDIKGVMSNDMQREYRVDVETDSTVAQSLQQDMEGMREVYTALIELWQGAGPAVASGALNIEVVKAMSLSVARRARMGLEVEDAIEQGMQAPKPQDNGEAQKAQAEAQKEQAITQREAQQTQADLQREQQASQEKVALDRQAKDLEHANRKEELRVQDEFNRWKVQEDNRTKVEVAEISAGAVLDKAEIDAANAADGDGGSAPERATPTGDKPAKPKRKGAIENLAEMHAQAMQAHAQTNENHGRLIEAVHGLARVAAAPRKAVRGPDGRVTHSVPDMATVQ